MFRRNPCLHQWFAKKWQPCRNNNSNYRLRTILDFKLFIAKEYVNKFSNLRYSHKILWFKSDPKNNYTYLPKVRSKSLIHMLYHWKCLLSLLHHYFHSLFLLQVYKPLLERFKALEDKITCLDWILFSVFFTQPNVPGEINVCELFLK